MRTGRMKWLVAALLPLLVLLAVASAAQAAGPVTLELQVPDRLALGEEVTVTAVLRDANAAPIPGAAIILWSPASFLSTGGAVTLGRAVTDGLGTATFLYQPRSEGAIALNAAFAGDSRYDAAQASAKVAVQGSVQLYQETAGVRVPGIGVWLLVGILGGVWSTYFAVMVFLTLIAREGTKVPAGAGGRHG